MTAVLTKPAQPMYSQEPRASKSWPKEKIGVAALLLATAVLYFWNLSINDYGNSFYAAAAQAGADNWTAFFFGSSDMANSITVDKTPLSLWPAMLAVKTFGLNSYTLLGPQAVLGVTSVALLYATVRRYHGVPAAMIAGWVLALTPVATLMFRFNNPDAMLVFLMIAAVWAGLRGVETGHWRWAVAAGMFLGLGFLAKQLQVLLIVPPLALMWLLCAPGGWLRRIGQLLAAAGAMIVAAGWYLLAVELWPKAARPYIGGSQNNSIMELTLGYNGLGRLNGNETGAVLPSGGTPQGGMWGETSIWRMFDSSQGGQIAWLLPLALSLFIIGLWLGRADRQRRASYLAWGGWLIVTALVFSFMQGIFHQYYTVALAPAISALVGIGLYDAYRSQSRIVNLLLAVAVAGSGVWAYVLLNRSTDFLPWLKYMVVIAAGIAAVAIVLRFRIKPRIALASMLVAGAIGLLSAPLAYSLETVGSSNTGSIPLAGPSVAGAGGPGGGPGGLLGGGTASEEVVNMLTENADNFTWVAATSGSQSAASYQLASGYSVMPIGGFNGSDPSPTLEQFQQWVAEGKIHYYIVSDGPGSGPGGQDDNSEQNHNSAIQTWIEENYTAQTVDGVTMYDLSS